MTKIMMKIRPILMLASFIMPAMFCSGQTPYIELKNDFFYLDGKKFFVRGLGYEVGTYPGVLPWNHTFNQDVLESDLQRIVDGGFNTIRTWNAFTNQELQVVQQYDLKIIMGIWIDPAGDFADPVFVNSALQLIRNVLSYSKHYDNIIAYLIMNEPMPDHIFDVGYAHAYILWKQAIMLIHELHPGVPVSIANTCVGDFIDPQIFDFSAYNIYPYNPATVNYSHQYPAYVRDIFHQREDDHPLVVTEYGLSVSPSGQGNWGYGGNTTEEQEAGIKYMFRSLTDGGASGSCVFNYSDGWWKAGNEFVHDDAAEEWFGLVEYASLTDKYGIPRPVWDSLKALNRAVIVSPKNQEIYSSKIPVELFTGDTIHRFTVTLENVVMLDEGISDNYFQDTLIIPLESIKDIALTFKFYTGQDFLIRTETIQMLATTSPCQLPEITIDVTPVPSQGDHTIQASFSIDNTGPLQTDYVLDYVFYTHTGWDYGVAATAYLSHGNPTHKQDYSYTSDVDVITLAAGINATYGNFSKRITRQNVYILGDTSHPELPSGILPENAIPAGLVIYPNPATDFICINENIHEGTLYQIMNTYGKILLAGKLSGKRKINICPLPEGIYLMICITDQGQLKHSTFVKTDQRF